MDSFWALLGSVVGKGLLLLSGIAVARFLGSEVYGEYGIIKTTLLTIATFSSFGLGITATKFVAEACKDANLVISIRKRCYQITFFSSGTIALLVFLFSNQIAVVLDAKVLSEALRYVAIAIVFNAVNATQIGILGGLKAYKHIANNNIKVGVFTFVITVIFTYFWNFNGAVIALASSLAFNCALNYLSIRKVSPKTETPTTPFSVLELVKFSLPVTLQESTYSATSWIASYILIKMSGYAELGLSTVGIQWMSVVLFIPGALRNVALSNLSSSNKDNKKNQKVLHRLLLVNFVSTFIPFVIVFALSGWIADMYGESYASLPSVLSIMLLVSVVHSLSITYTQEFISRNRNWFLFISRLIRDALMLFAMYAILHYYTCGAFVHSCCLFVSHLIYLLLLMFIHRRIVRSV